MPKKKGDRTSPRSLANLSSQAAKKEEKVRINAYLRSESKHWLNKGKDAVGEEIDLAVFFRRNWVDLIAGTVQIGLMRLVNPDRGRLLCANIQLDSGTLSARTSNFKQFGLYCVVGGREFYPGREFSRWEFSRWFGAEALPQEDRETEDELGKIPATHPNPTTWKWYAIDSRGERNLKQSSKPNLVDLQKVAGYALTLREEEFYPFIDNWECWVCDRKTLQPLALVLTANSREEIETLTYSPMWRFCSNAEHEQETRKFENEINNRINTASKPGRWGFNALVFERHLDNSVTEYAPDGKVTHHPIGHLPIGELTEPFEKKRLELLNKCSDPQ